jgi:hypothetical protein
MVIATRERTNGVWVPGIPEDESKPTLDHILTLFTESLRYFSAFRSQCETEEDYYHGRRNVPHPPGIDPVWPATAGAIVNVATDHVDVNNLSIDVPSAPRSRARAERIKKFYQGAWLSIKKPVLRTSVRQAFLYGIAWMKDMFDADRWPDAPVMDEYGDDEPAYKAALKEFMEKRNIAWPIEVSVVNPKNLLWDDSKIRTKWVIEYYDQPVRELTKRYPEWTTGKKSEDMATWKEYWDEEWVAYLADDQFVWGPKRHGYKHLPFVPVLPVQSHTFEDGNPEDRYKGILKPVHSLLDEEARLVTQIGSIVRTTAWRTLDFHGPESAAKKVADGYELFGGKNIVTPGVTVEMSPMAQVPPDLYQQLNVVQTLIESATFPNVIRGVRPRGVSTGFAISVLAGMGRLVFQGVADGIRHAIEDVNSNMARLVEHKLRGKVTVYARTEIHNFDQAIGPEDFKGFYENSVQVKAEAPEERERESLLAMRLHQAGIIALYEAQRRSGVLNPLEEQMQMRAEQLLNTPEFLAAQSQQLMERIGLGQQLAQSVETTGGGGGVGSQNVGGAQLQRPGERNIQQARVASREGRPSVFPQGLSGLDILGKQLGGPTGGAVGMPSGQTIRGGSSPGHPVA